MKVKLLEKSLILLIFVLFSCQKDYYLGDVKEHPTYAPSHQAYIYDERISSLSYPYCHIMGTINGHEVNRRSDVKKGYIHIGTSNQYSEEECDVSLILSRHQRIILYIRGHKQIYIE